MANKVKLLSKHLKAFQVIQDSGSYNSEGEWVESLQAPIDFTAAPFPITGNDLRLFPEGDLSLEDTKIYTKYNLDEFIDKKVIRVSTSKEFLLKSIKKYDEIADLKIYILKRWDGES